MTEAAIPFGSGQETGREAIAGAQGVSMNIVLDGRGAMRRRPGIGAWFDERDTIVDSYGIAGLHQAADGRVFAVSARDNAKQLYRVTRSASVALNHSVVGQGRPISAETQSLVVFAAGAQLSRIELAGGTAAFLNGNPPKTTHVAAIASRLVIPEVTNKDLRNNFHFSAPQAGAGVAGYETWNGVGDSGTLSANARPDAIQGIYENTNELFVFGKTNLQTFAPDPQSVWAPVTTREFGTTAKYSVIRDDQSFAWLDDKKRFVHSDGRTFKVLSDAIQRDLDELQNPEDCIGYRIKHGVTDVLVWTFLTDGRTFVASRDGSWSQWSGWDGSWTRFPVLASAQGETQNLVGLVDGRMGVMSSSATTDLGAPVNCYTTTGFIDRDTKGRKTCKCITIVARRTLGAGPIGFLSWRDDLGPWGQPLPVELGVSAIGEIVVRFYSLGVYRQRQWKFDFATEGDTVLGSVTEDYEAAA